MADLTEGYQSSITVLEGDADVDLALKRFVEESSDNPNSFQKALDELISKPSIASDDPAVVGARHIIDSLLDRSDDGFNIDYDWDYITDVLVNDKTYQVLRAGLKELEPHERVPQLRALAARGLWLYIEQSRESSA